MMRGIRTFFDEHGICLMFTACTFFCAELVGGLGGFLIGQQKDTDQYNAGNDIGLHYAGTYALYGVISGLFPLLIGCAVLASQAYRNRSRATEEERTHITANADNRTIEHDDDSCWSKVRRGCINVCTNPRAFFYGPEMPDARDQEQDPEIINQFDAV